MNCNFIANNFKKKRKLIFNYLNVIVVIDFNSKNLKNANKIANVVRCNVYTSMAVERSATVN